MILAIGLTIIDLGRASSLTPIVKKVEQNKGKTAGGLDYTQTWDYYERGGYKFDFEWIEKSLFEELEGFMVLDAEGSRNPFILTMDDSTVHPVSFFEGDLAAGEIETLGTSEGVKNVYLNVSFSVKNT